MADKDLNSIIDQLITALKAAAGDKYTSPTKSPSVKLSTEQGEVSKRVSELDLGELNKFIAEQENLSKKILENIDVAEKNAKETIDSEQIINELKEERISQIKQEFRQNQLVLLELRKQYDLIKEKNSEEAITLKAKIDALDEQIKKQAELLEKDKKQKELKEGILSIVKQTWEMSKQYGSELEKHIIAISKSNGGYAGLLSNLREAGRLSQAVTLGTGITGEENMRALESLSDGFIGLTTYSAQSISNMQVATAQLTKVGVSSTVAAKGFDSLVLAMGKTPEQAGKIQESFVQMAAKNRLALGAVSQAFAENSSRFVGYGEQMKKVLDGLAEQSLKTGIAIGKLVAIAQQFDTFEGAAKAVGNLNALLGGDYFNSIELLTASDEERIKLLKDGVAASGMQWESMNRFQKMAIANAAGISDLNEASKLFGKTSLENTRQQAESAAVQKTLAEQAASVSLGMDKLKSTLNGLFIALDPLIEAFRMIVDFLTFIPRKIAEAGSPILSAITSIAIFVGLLAIKNTVLGGSWNYIANSIANATARLAAWKAANAAGGGMEGITKFKDGPASIASAAPAATSPASSATSGLLANAGNMLKAAGAILLFSLALLALAKALQELSSDSIKKEGIGLALFSIIALAGMAKLLERVGVSFATGSIAIILIAGSLFILGMALKQFSGIDWKLVAGIGAIILGLGLAIVGFGMAVSGPQALFIAAGIAMVIGIAGALLILGNSLEKISTSFKTLSELKNIGELSSNLISFLDDLADTSVSPINDLANAIGLLAENLQKLASVSSNMAVNVSGNAKTVLTEQVNAAATAVTKTSESVSNATANINSQALIPAQQTTAFVPLVVQIDKETIVKILQKDIEGIAIGQAQNVLDATGLVQSSFEVVNRVSANKVP
jgi:hypothetical protein